MNYFTLLLKKSLKRWLNIIPIIIVVIFIIFIYYGNNKTTYSQIKSGYFEKELKGWESDALSFKEKLKRYEPNTEEYDIIKSNLNIAEKKVDSLSSRITAYNHHNWKAYYENDIKYIEVDLKNVEKDKDSYSSDLPDILKLDIKYANYMKDHGLAYDLRFAPVQGMSYMAYFINNYLPIIIAVLVMFIVSNMYCSSFVENIDIHKMIPIGNLKKQSSKLMVGLFYGTILFLFFSIICVVCGGLWSSFGSIQAPILTYTLDGANQYISFGSILPKLLILLIFSILFIVNMVSIIANITKKNLTCFLIAAVIILGLMWVTTNIVPLRSITHLVPTTYLN